ncbi:MAG: hypothetical protein ABSH28_10905 [Acidobacteriota bacterium]
MSSILAVMRTTLHIDDDIYQAAKSIAEVERRSVGEVLSSLARRALAPRPYAMDKEGLPAFIVSDSATPLTMPTVKKALEEE